MLPSARAALEATRAETTTFTQCALGAAARKYTTLAHATALSPHLGRLRDAVCAHGDDGHPAVAYGRDAQGRARSALAAAYPPEDERRPGGGSPARRRKAQRDDAGGHAEGRADERRGAVGRAGDGRAHAGPVRPRAGGDGAPAPAAVRLLPQPRGHGRGGRGHGPVPGRPARAAAGTAPWPQGERWTTSETAAADRVGQRLRRRGRRRRRGKRRASRRTATGAHCHHGPLRTRRVHRAGADVVQRRGRDGGCAARPRVGQRHRGPPRAHGRHRAARDGAVGTGSGLMGLRGPRRLHPSAAVDARHHIRGPAADRPRSPAGSGRAAELGGRGHRRA
eukprot:871977-Pleurochrysis_carterae.AAC.1